MNSNQKSIVALLLLPAAFSLFYLVTSLFRLFDDGVAGILETVPFPLFTILITIMLIVSEKKHSLPLKIRDKYAYTMPAFMAPTALFSAWTLAPSHLGGVAWGGVHYFIEAITKYPNLGSVNSILFLGMLSVLCASYLPVIIAWGYLSIWSKRTMYVLALLSVAAYLIVASKLDANLWIAGLYGTEQHSLVFLMYGPISRTLAIISACYLVMRMMFDPIQK